MDRSNSGSWTWIVSRTAGAFISSIRPFVAPHLRHIFGFEDVGSKLVKVAAGAIAYIRGLDILARVHAPKLGPG